MHRDIRGRVHSLRSSTFSTLYPFSEVIVGRELTVSPGAMLDSGGDGVLHRDGEPVQHRDGRGLHHGEREGLQHSQRAAVPVPTGTGDMTGCHSQGACH